MFATHLPAGTYDYTYPVRASLAGTFNVMPSHAEEMYFPEVFGRGDGSVFVVENEARSYCHIANIKSPD